MKCLKSGFDIFLKHSIQLSVVNSHTVTHKSIAPADNTAQMQFNCSGLSDYYIDLNSVCLLLRIKLVKIYRSDLESAEANSVGCLNNLLRSTFSSLSKSLNRKPVTLHKTNYHYKAYLKKLLNYGFDASGKHLVSSFCYLDSSGELKDNSGYVRRLNYLRSDNTIELYGWLHVDLFNSDKM